MATTTPYAFALPRRGAKDARLVAVTGTVEPSTTPNIPTRVVGTPLMGFIQHRGGANFALGRHINIASYVTSTDYAGEYDAVLSISDSLGADVANTVAVSYNAFFLGSA